MSLAHFNFYSKYLRGNTDIYVILPDLPNGADPEAFYSGEKNIPFSGYCTAEVATIPTGSAKA